MQVKRYPPCADWWQVEISQSMATRFYGQEQFSGPEWKRNIQLEGVKQMGARVSFPDGERLDTFQIEVEAIQEFEKSNERDILLNALKTLHKSVFRFMMTPNDNTQATLEQVWNMAGNTLVQIEGASK